MGHPISIAENLNLLKPIGIRKKAINKRAFPTKIVNKLD